jgi:hypothetical protein
MAKNKKAVPETFDEPAPAGEAAASVPAPVGVSRFQKFVVSRVHRSQLKNAPYNPRTISEEAKKRLKKMLSKRGLLETLIWNAKTGNLVGGHQRLSCIDALEGSQDYHLDVAQVDLTPKEEKEANIALNNGEVQGDWDYGKLEQLFKADKLDFEDSGFSTAEIYQMFGDSPLVAQPEALVQAAEKVRAARAQYDKTLAARDDADDPNFYIVVVFQYTRIRDRFLKTLGLDDNRFVDGRRLIEKLGGLPEDEEAAGGEQKGTEDEEQQGSGQNLRADGDLPGPDGPEA